MHAEVRDLQGDEVREELGTLPCPYVQEVPSGSDSERGEGEGGYMGTPIGEHLWLPASAYLASAVLSGHGLWHVLERPLCM